MEVNWEMELAKLSPKSQQRAADHVNIAIMPKLAKIEDIYIQNDVIIQQKE